MTDADFHAPDSEEPTTALDHVTIENDDAPDECAIFPYDASEDELMTAWISAYDGSFVALESMR
ncbi:DUF7511 domain-containing protein [Natrinema versiforme]|uniref:DUF7511 domain-containing protein n=1 Tax=Natrinema versiforme JCM 10478 TaxID=1227496 RepID=L9YDA4_9EURY|nr:hypothetical protein [Natrinema versiforme]ELY70903.1 hypothetical protein C489_01056 [Natrinema versiforme JCM 10478]